MADIEYRATAAHIITLGHTETFLQILLILHTVCTGMHTVLLVVLHAYVAQTNVKSALSLNWDKST